MSGLRVANGLRWLVALGLTAAGLSLMIGCRGLIPPAASHGDDVAALSRSLLRVNVTRQGYYPRRPWQPESPQSVSAVGVVLNGGRVLVSAGVVADQRYIELERIETGAKCPALVVAVDYEADLALVVGEAPSFMAGLQPLAIGPGGLPGDRLQVLQVQPSGRVIASDATVSTVELVAYPYGNQFLAYRLSGSLQNRHGHISLPVVYRGQLAGLVSRDHGQAQTLEATPVELIAHFLKDTDDGHYDGFPLSGIQFVPAQDPELRRYLGLGTRDGGVFVESVMAGSPARQADIRVGDVIMAIDAHAIDNRGFYRDSRLGRVGIAHLIRCAYQAGDRVSLTLMREGRPMRVDLTLNHRPAQEDLVPPHHHDRQPAYYVLGGLVLQELSATYLMDFGKDWIRNAPIHLLYLHHNQFDLTRPPGEKIVVLNSVLPTSATIGYESIGNTVVQTINTRPIRRLTDVPRALEHPRNGFHCIQIDQPPFKIYLDAADLEAVDAQVQERYNLPTLHPFDAHNDQ